MLKHLRESEFRKVEQREVRDLLLVELLAQIRRWIELRENVVDAREFIAAQIMMTTQCAPHFVEVAIDLFERAFESNEQTRALDCVDQEVLDAEGFEGRGIAIGRAPTTGDAGDTLCDSAAMRFAMGRCERVNGASDGSGKRKHGGSSSNSRHARSVTQTLEIAAHLGHNARMLRNALACLLSVMVLTACASTEVVERFGRVKMGMTKDEVIDLLGAPSSKWPLVIASDGFDGERLQWGDSLSSLASSSAFKGEPDRAYSVVFDASGKVVRMATPEWVAEEDDETATLRARREQRADQ